MSRTDYDTESLYIALEKDIHQIGVGSVQIGSGGQEWTKGDVWDPNGVADQWYPRDLSISPSMLDRLLVARVGLKEILFNCTDVLMWYV